jgi:hypothetical protein
MVTLILRNLRNSAETFFKMNEMTYELESNLIWNTIKDTLQGKEIPYRPQSYDSVEFGVISQKEITQTLREVFGDNTPKKRHGNSRVLVFDKLKLDKLSKIYDIDKVQVVTGSSSPHMPHSPHVGLDRHIEDESQVIEITKKHEQTCNNSKQIAEGKTNVTSTGEYNDVQHSQQVAEVAEVADMVLAEPSIKIENNREKLISNDSNIKNTT